MMRLLETRALKKTYGSGAMCVDAVRGIDLEVEQGEFLAIMGPSGSGKSTLLHLLGGVDRPSSGQVLLEGADLTALGDDDRTILRRRRIGFIFQSFNLLPTLYRRGKCPPTVGTGRHAGGSGQGPCGSRSGDGRHAAPPQASAECPLRRRAAARGDRAALAIEPALLLADEPTGNLDTSNGTQVTTLLRRLVDERRETIVMVTHDQNVAAHADRLVCLRDGLIESDNGQLPLLHRGEPVAMTEG